MNKTDLQVLRACEASCNIGAPYHPGSGLASNANRMVDLNLMSRNGGVTGGFWITEDGRRENRKNHTARVLHSPRPH